MNKKKLGAAGFATVALTALALIAPTAAFADSSVPPAVGSGATQTDQAVYVLDPELGTPLTQGSSIAWGLQVFGGPSATDPEATFPAPAATTNSVYTFISPRGSERNFSAWNGYLYQGGTGAVSLAAISPANLATTGTGSPAGAAAVAAAGGDWSLGVAWTNGSNVVKVAYTYITITPGTPSTATYTFAQPAAAGIAPVVTTQPTSQSAVVGGNVTFTAAASGTPAPTVKWQSAPVATSTFTDIAGATSNTLTVSNVQVAATGTQYRAVYTNASGSVNSDVAVLTVNGVVPTEPTGTDPNKLASPTLTEGQSSFTLTGTGVAAGTYSVWAWSDPTQLPNATVLANGNVTINVSSLAPGAHTLALTAINSSTVVAWLTIDIPAPTYPLVSNTDLTVDVTTSNKFALEGVAAALNLGSAARGGVTSADLPAFTVTDDRDTLPGWDLTSKVNDFVNDGVAVPANAGDTIDKGALTIEPRKVGPAVTGISAKTEFTAGTSNLFAEGLLNSSTPSTGTQFDAQLTFNVPATAKKGTYKSLLTLTLTSK